MIKGLVSAIVPTYNRRQFICETVDSILAQTYRNLEVIVVDDGSTDGTGELLKQRYGSVPRFRYIWQENAERAVARNTGIMAAQGEFIAFLDSDDLWLPEKLANQLAQFHQQPEIVLSHTGYTHIDVSGQEVDQVVPPPQDSINQNRVFRRLLLGNTIGAPTVLIRRSALEHTGFFCEDRRLLAFEDWEMWTRLAYQGTIGYIPEPLAKYRLHPGNTFERLTWKASRSFLQSLWKFVSWTDRFKIVHAGCLHVYSLLRFYLRKMLPW
jgi:glycosyltransferase involved in cell wall biosynthesis